MNPVHVPKPVISHMRGLPLGSAVDNRIQMPIEKSDPPSGRPDVHMLGAPVEGKVAPNGPTVAEPATWRGKVGMRQTQTTAWSGKTATLGTPLKPRPSTRLGLQRRRRGPAVRQATICRG